jgi:hypothetical protein
LLNSDIPDQKNFANGMPDFFHLSALPMTTMKNPVRGGVVPAAPISQGYGIVRKIIFASLACDQRTPRRPGLLLPTSES